MCATQTRNQISTQVTLSCCKFPLFFFYIFCPSFCLGVETSTGGGNLCHLFHMSRNEIALKLFQISLAADLHPAATSLLDTPRSWTFPRTKFCLDASLSVCSSPPSFPRVSVLILAVWGSGVVSGIWSGARNLFQTVSRRHRLNKEINAKQQLSVVQI